MKSFLNYINASTSDEDESEESKKDMSEFWLKFLQNEGNDYGLENVKIDIRKCTEMLEEEENKPILEKSHSYKFRLESMLNILSLFKEKLANENPK